MENEALTMFQQAQLKWLKQQVDNLIDEQLSSNPRPRIQQEIFAAREELDTYVKNLRATGVQI
jgi:hypothetical protein